jgi:group II intron reverse transcriptase/maturase
MDAKTYIERLKRIRSLNEENAEFVNTDLYRLLLKDECLIYGYEKIKSNKGSITPATTIETLDGFGRERLDKLKSRLADESWQPKPARRKYIEKKKPGKKEMRPLGIQGPEEKIVQASMLSILEAIYEPIFLDLSYGFRPQRGAHDALISIERNYDGISFIIEGDIKGMYDNVNHKVLVSLVEEKIKDARFIRLLWKMLRAGYMDTDTSIIKPVLGTPQGSIVSPILANIYLHQLDIFMRDRCTDKLYKRRKDKTPIYHKKSYICRKLKKEIEGLPNGPNRDQQIKAFNEAKKDLLQTRVYKNPEQRIYYTRYADDFIVGIAGSRELADKLRNEIGNFLDTKLKLTLNPEKTTITDPRKGRAYFLGHEIYIDTSEKLTYIHAKGKAPFRKRTTGKFVKIVAPIDKMIKRLCTKGFCDSRGNPTPKKIWTTQEDNRIISLYNQTILGLFNFYGGCHFRHRLGRIWYILKFSCSMTLASKHKSSISKMFKKHGPLLTVRYGREGERTISLKEQSFKESSRKWVTGRHIADPYRLMAFRLTKTKIDEKCCICGDLSSHMHHIRHVKDSKPGTFASLMGLINRKQIPVCINCHNSIHSGRYDSLSLKDLADPDLAKR